MWTKAFWLAALERAIRGFAIAALTVIGGDAVNNAFNVDWLDVIGFGLFGAAVSVLMSLAGNAISKSGPSFNRREVVRPVVPPVE